MNNFPLSVALGLSEAGFGHNSDTTFDDPMPTAVGSHVRLGGSTKMTDVEQETTDDD